MLHVVASCKYSKSMKYKSRPAEIWFWNKIQHISLTVRKTNEEGPRDVIKLQKLIKTRKMLENLAITKENERD